MSRCSERTFTAPRSVRSSLRVPSGIVVVVLSTVGIAALVGTIFVQPVPRWVYNPSESVPTGWYRIDPAHRRHDSLRVGSVVLTRLPVEAAILADKRNYLPIHIPLLKRVSAVAPQHVCIMDDQVHIDGVPVTTVLPVDRLGRSLPFWQSCRPLVKGELFLLSHSDPASFDSRYFGPVNVTEVIGVAHPVWHKGQSR